MSAPTEYRVQACNLSHASENKIHDDAVAKRFGFGGGLVPGVELYAYMTHLPVARWGIEWLARGTAECRFVKPVYDGREVTVSATASGGTLTIALESEGRCCASGAAAVPDVANERAAAGAPQTAPMRDTPNERPAAGSAPQTAPMRDTENEPPAAGAPQTAPMPDRSNERAAAAVGVPQDPSIPDPADRPEASEASLAPGRRLSSRPLHLAWPELQSYLAAIRETEALYAQQKLVHPAFMLRLCNLALKDNVKLGPWIHVASSIAHQDLAHADDILTAHATVTANYERKGHRFVDLDVSIVSQEHRPIAQVRHTALYRLRGAEAAD